MASSTVLPNLIVVGAMKGGTTSLHRYLGMHPEINMSKMKELNFFDTRVNWSRGMEWYSSQFNPGAKIIGETSPLYARYPRSEGIVERMADVVPDAKLIYMVRDPINRLLSHYIEVVDQFRILKPFEEILPNIENEQEGFVSCSQYHMQIECFLQQYDESRLHVVSLEDMNAEPQRVMKRIFEFLDVDANFWTDAFLSPHNTTGEKRRPHPLAVKCLPGWLFHEMATPRRVPWRVANWMTRACKRFGKKIERPNLSEAETSRLLEIFKDDVEKLRRFTGDPFSRWKPY